MLADRLKERRKAKGVTQKDVASFLEMSVSTYQKYELSIIEPNNTTLRALAGYFGCSTDYLLGLTEYKAEHEKTKLFQDLSSEDNQILANNPKILKVIQLLDDLTDSKNQSAIKNPDLLVCMRELMRLSKDELLDMREFVTFYASFDFSKTNRHALHNIIISILTFHLNE